MKCQWRAFFQSAIFLDNLRSNQFGIVGPSTQSDYPSSSSVSSGPWRWTPLGVEVDCTATPLPLGLQFPLGFVFLGYLLYTSTSSTWGKAPSRVDAQRRWVELRVQLNVSYYFPFVESALMVNDGPGPLWTGQVSVYCRETLVLLLSTVSHCGDVLAW